MDWYLGRKPRDRSSIDDRVESLARAKSYFPSEHYRKAQAEKRETRTFGNYFPTKEYFAIRETRNKERAEKRNAKNQTISSVYNGALVPAVKGTYNIASDVAKGTYNVASDAVKGTWTVIKGAASGTAYVAGKTKELVEEIADNSIDARRYEDLDNESRYQPEDANWYRVDKHAKNIFEKVQSTGKNAQKMRDLEKLAADLSAHYKVPISVEESFVELMEYLDRINGRNQHYRAQAQANQGPHATSQGYTQATPQGNPQTAQAQPSPAQTPNPTTSSPGYFSRATTKVKNAGNKTRGWVKSVYDKSTNKTKPIDSSKYDSYFDSDEFKNRSYSPTSSKEKTDSKKESPLEDIVEDVNEGRDLQDALDGMINSGTEFRRKVYRGEFDPVSPENPVIKPGDPKYDEVKPYVFNELYGTHEATLEKYRAKPEEYNYEKYLLKNLSQDDVDELIMWANRGLSQDDVDKLSKWVDKGWDIDNDEYPRITP